jgi:hypothetical protein
VNALFNSGFLVVEVSPVNNEINVPINTPVVIRFSFDMIEETISASSLLFTKVNGPTVAASVSYDRRTRSAFVEPIADLEKGVQYRLTIVGGEDGISSITGNQLPENLMYEFQTTYDVSVTSPSALSATVLNGYVTLNWLTPSSYNNAKELSYKVYISTSSLDPDQDPASVLWPMISDNLADIKGTTINVGRSLGEGAYYAYVRAINGTANSPYIQYQFLIDAPPEAGGPVNTGPSGIVFEVNATYPETDSVNVSPDSIKILFTEELDMNTVSKSTVYIVKAVKPKTLNLLDFMTKFAPSKAIDFTIDSPTVLNLISLTIDPEIIEPNTEYTVIIRETVKSISGIALGEAHCWSFMSLYSPMFGDAERIRDDIKIFLRNVSDKVLYRYMYDATLTALDVVSTVISPFIQETFVANPPRYIGEYVRFQVGYDLVVNAIIQETNGIGSSRTLGDLTVQPNQNISQVNDILANLKSRIKPWEDQLHGHHNRGYAKPTTAVKGETGAVYPDFLTRTELADPSEG